MWFFGICTFEKMRFFAQNVETSCCPTATTARIDTLQMIKSITKSWSFYSFTFWMRKSGILMPTYHIISIMKFFKFSRTSFNSRLERFEAYLHVLRSWKRKSMTKWNFCSIVNAMKRFNVQNLKVQIFNIFFFKFSTKSYVKMLVNTM